MAAAVGNELGYWLVGAGVATDGCMVGHAEGCAVLLTGEALGSPGV